MFPVLKVIMVLILNTLGFVIAIATTLDMNVIHM